MEEQVSTTTTIITTKTRSGGEKTVAKAKDGSLESAAVAVPEVTSSNKANTQETTKHLEDDEMNDASPCSSVDSINTVESKTDIRNSSGASRKLVTTDSNTSCSLSTNSSTSSGNSSQSNQCTSDGLYFFEDEVFRIEKHGRVQFGMITETFSDEADNINLAKGEVRVIWYSKGNESVHYENTIGLADRTLMPGDVVKRLVPGKDTQLGYCRDIHMTADVQVLHSNYVIKNVNTERLKSVSEWPGDNVVCLGSWVGSIRTVERKAILRASNGCRFEISSKSFRNFCDTINMYTMHVFFTGNTVIGRIPNSEDVKILTPEIPLNVSRKNKRIRRKFYVEKVYTDAVWVRWQCKALSEDELLDGLSHQPNPCVRGEDLKRLKRLTLFESCMMQLSDRCTLKYSSCDTIVKLSDWEAEQSVKFKLLLQQQREDNQKLFASEAPSVTQINSSAIERFKKKASIIEEKLIMKLKRNSFKLEKSGNPSSKDKPQESVLSKKQSSPNKEDTMEREKNENGKVQKGEDNAESDGAFSELAALLRLSQAEEDEASTTATHSTCSSPSPRASPKNNSKRLLRKSQKDVKPLLLEHKEFSPKEGDEQITEAILVRSTATVVWQDGTIESSIPSTELYPIHHLDNHEFFPGDFVIADKEDYDANYRDYGVIQSVDHLGRIAQVKWFTTYLSPDDPIPDFKGMSEHSVYDLKDHPDFQYRPGTMVIRVSSLASNEAKSTAGQIIDNYRDGRVMVWWVEGHISMCWPQDLYEVGQNDQTEGHESDDSWETESVNSELGGDGLVQLSSSESHILCNIEKVRGAIARLEEIFTISPALQNPDAMRKLLTVYKGCRYLDRLLNSNFFHETNFMGLIERVRLGGEKDHKGSTNDGKNAEAASCNSSNNEEDNSLYSAVGTITKWSQRSLNHSALQTPASSSKEYAPKVVFSFTTSHFKCHNSGGSLCSNCHANLSPSGSAKKGSSAPATIEVTPIKNSVIVPSEKKSNIRTVCDKNKSADAPETLFVTQFEISPNRNKQFNSEKQQLLNTAMVNIEKAFEKTKKMHEIITTVATPTNLSTSQDDSGNFSRNENCDGSPTSCTSASDLSNIETPNSLSKAADNEKCSSCNSIELTDGVTPESSCVRLCGMLKTQLMRCLDDIRDKYYKDDLAKSAEVLDINQLSSDGYETVIKIEEGPSTDKNKLKQRVVAADAKAAMGKLENGNANQVKESVDLPVIAADEPDSSYNEECFQVLSNAPKSHKYYANTCHPHNAQQYYRAIQKEHRMLKNSLPPGVWVKTFEDRMDLLSVLIEGPKNTPYEDGMFLFDMQLTRTYPKDPPTCFYSSYCTDRLNPNLYEDGKVCVSLLGTWNGTDTEVWGPKSSLLQVIVSIQGLILVPEPYYNEAGYEKQKDTQQGKENSRMYNEMVIIKVVQAMTKMVQKPPVIFRDEILRHFKRQGPKMYERIKGWMELSPESRTVTADSSVAGASQNLEPGFPLVPASRGFCLTLTGLLEIFKKTISALNSAESTPPESSHAAAAMQL